MSDSSLNPSQQVERIREILVGRQMHQVEDRLSHIEAALQAPAGQHDDETIRRMEAVQASVLQEIHDLRTQLQNESRLRGEQIAQLSEHLNAATRRLEAASSELHRQEHQVEQHLSHHLENISSAMAARIDARVREILQHLQVELGQWKHQMDRDILAVRDSKVDRHELQSKFARLAAAAMEDPAPADSSHHDGGYIP